MLTWTLIICLVIAVGSCFFLGSLAVRLAKEKDRLELENEYLTENALKQEEYKNAIIDQAIQERDSAHATTKMLLKELGIEDEEE